MKISYYELLGLIKEEKNPTKVVYDDNVYIWDGDNYKAKKDSYITEKMHEKDMFKKDIILLELKEIIEEDKEIEEIDLGIVTPNGEYIIPPDTGKIQDKINEIIRELNKMKKEGKK